MFPPQKTTEEEKNRKGQKGGRTKTTEEEAISKKKKQKREQRKRRQREERRFLEGALQILFFEQKSIKLEMASNLPNAKAKPPPGVHKSIKFRGFPPDKIRDNRIFLLLGPRGSGKTTMMKTIMWHLRHRVEFVVAFLGTEETVIDFKGIIPDSLMYCGITSFNTDMISQVISLQENWSKLGSFHEDKNAYRIKSILIVMDDMMVDNTWLKSSAILELHNNGRHLGISVLNAAQYCMSLPPNLRTQIDYVVVFYSPALDWIDKLYKNFFGGYFTMPDFKKVYAKLTENRRAIVLDNTTKGIEAVDCIFTMSADPNIVLNNRPFTMGSDAMWRLAYMFTKTNSQRMRETENQYAQLANRIMDSKINQFSILRDGTAVGRSRSPVQETKPRRAPARPRSRKKEATVAREPFRLGGAEFSICVDEES